MRKLILSILLLCLAAIQLRPQPSEAIHFLHIGLDKGLSQGTIFDITQDRLGNMWFATYNGVNKYNGYTFKVYQHDEADPFSIGSDMVRSCYTDSQGRIWIGTAGYLSLYNSDKDNFLNYTCPNRMREGLIDDIVELDERHLLLLIDQKLQLFDTEELHYCNDKLPEKLKDLNSYSLSKYGDYLYIGSRAVAYIYSITQKTLKELPLHQFAQSTVMTMLPQSATRLWIGTEGHGLLLINPQTGSIKQYKHVSGRENSLSANYVRSLSFDSKKRLWIGTINSLNIYDEEQDCFHVYESNKTGSGVLSQSSVRTIYEDMQGGMWVGTYFGGLNYYHPLKNRFFNLPQDGSINSLNDKVINSIVEDKHKTLWIGTNNGGVNRYDTEHHTFVHYTTKEGLASDDVKAIYVDEDNDWVYIGTHTGGLSRLHRPSGRIESLTDKNVRNIYDIEPVGDGTFWLSCMSNIYHFNPRTRTFTRIPMEQKTLRFGIAFIYRDSHRRLWIGGKNGVATFTDEGGKLVHTKIFAPDASFCDKYTNCVYEASDGRFWLGTYNGLYCFDAENSDVKHYTIAQGLPNNAIYGILEDSYGKLWLSTDYGLCHMNPQTETFRTFSSTDGLQSNQFTQNAYCCTTDGQMYFGGINGVTTFTPELLVDNPYTPPVVITQLRLFNKPVLPGDESGILEKDISMTQRITLTAKQKMFSLEFVVSNYISGSHNTFAYTLKGYDKEWYYSDTQRLVSYSNLPQGTYRFLVKAANSDGKWNEVPTELEIVILPVWYKTWWAFLLFAAAFVTLMILIFRYFWTRKSMEAQLHMERVEKEKQQEVNEMKVRFFIDIAHELRTPLTLILAPLQEALAKSDDRWMRRQLEHIQRNANRLMHLVNQLMDYRRAELGVFVLHAYRNSILKSVEKTVSFYEALAQRKKIHYSLYSDLEQQEVLCDPSYIELMLNNLLSNAFKYTGTGESISVVLKMEADNRLLLQVQDTGSGIPQQKQEKIFERFYQAENTHIGSGIGLSLVKRLVELHHGTIELESEEGNGSTFSIYLPTNTAAYRQEEIGKGPATDMDNLHSTNTQQLYVLDGMGDLAPEEEEEKDVEKNEVKKKRENVLIVEDNLEILHYLSSELGNTYTVWEATHGEEALEVVKEQEIDLILTDVMMPVMNGLQLCKQIKQNVHTCHIPVIILSAKADVKEQLEGLQVGADDYIPKPFSLAVVTTKIRNLFRTRYRAIQYYSKSLEIEPEKMALHPMDEEMLNRAKAIVEAHLDDADFSTESFAREMCMSRSSLHLKMKALTGESTYDFIRKIRFNKACKLLKDGHYTVAEISAMVGFSTSSYFSTSFKKYFGCMPTEYVQK